MKKKVRSYFLYFCTRKSTFGIIKEMNSGLKCPFHKNESQNSGTLFSWTSPKYDRLEYSTIHLTVHVISCKTVTNMYCNVFVFIATHSYETDTLVNWIEFSLSSRIDEHIWCHHLSALFYKKAASIINYLLHEAEEALYRSRIMDKWWLDPKFSTAQIHIPIPNRKFCKMYENVAFFFRKNGWVKAKRYDVKECVLHGVYWVNL